MRSHFSLDIIIVYYYYCTVLYCTVLYLINYVPQPKETKGYMRSDFSLNTIIILSYIITTVLYCTVLYYCIVLYLINFVLPLPILFLYPLLIMLSQI